MDEEEQFGPFDRVPPKKRNKIIKIILYVVNVLVIILGIIVLVIGIYLMYYDLFVTSTSKDEDTKHYFKFGPIATAVIGACIIVTSCLGFVGVVLQKKPVLIAYCGVLTVILVLLIISAVLARLYKEKLEKNAKAWLIKKVTKYDANDTSNPATMSYDQLQRGWECCGFVDNSSSDKPWHIWKRNSHFRGKIKVPESCCKLKASGEPFDCQSNPSSSNAFTTDDCFVALETTLSKYKNTLVGTVLAVAIVLLLIILLSGVLIQALKREGAEVTAIRMSYAD